MLSAGLDCGEIISVDVDVLLECQEGDSSTQTPRGTDCEGKYSVRRDEIPLLRGTCGRGSRMGMFFA